MNEFVRNGLGITSGKWFRFETWEERLISKIIGRPVDHLFTGAPRARTSFLFDTEEQAILFMEEWEANRYLEILRAEKNDSDWTILTDSPTDTYAPFNPAF